ncbi:MAG: hypothetical protein C0516_15605 [Gemmatimonas sp.]|nr:hypothetical protein [Gemmatimonas sp.]
MKDMQSFVLGLVSRLSYGDAISIVQVFEAKSDQVVEFRDSIPNLRTTGRPVRREKLMLLALRDSFAKRAKRLTDTTGMKAVVTTDILGFLRRASNYGRTRGNRKVVIVVLSDMLQSVPNLDFERDGVVPTAGWIESQRKSGLVPMLSGACMVAVGVDEGTVRATQVKRFWLDYARAAGGDLRSENYRMVMEASEIQC